MTESTVFRGRIFISYRREETAYPAGWLFDRLTEQFSSSQIFKDVDSIEPGDDFVQKIIQAVTSCNVLLALIGKEWLTIKNENGQRRLDNPEDFVRIEIETALTRNIRVIPILVNEAKMPHAYDLPASLAGLTRRQAIELNPVQFNYGTNRLLKVLDMTLAELRTTQPGLAPASLSLHKPLGQNTKETSQKPDEQKSTGWKADLISRSRVEVTFRLYAGSRQHFIKFRRKLGKDVIFIDGEPVLKKSEFSQAEFPVSDEYGQIQVNFKLTKGSGMELAEAFVNGLSYGLIKRIGRIRITVDNVLVYED